MQLLQRRLRTSAVGSLCNRTSTKLFILVLIQIHVFGVTAERTCHQCRGINCQRTSFEAIEKCSNSLDICVNVFNGQTILAQGCLEQLPQDLRAKCMSSKDNEPLSECYKCNSDLCNTFAASSFECIQCDSNTESNCSSNSSSLNPSRCQISRSPNQYCYVKQDANRVIRGCSLTVAEQKSCLSAEGCMICQPSELSGCNRIDVVTEGSDGSGSGGSQGSGSESGGGGSEGSGSGGSQGSGSGGSQGSGSESGGGGSESGSDGSGSGGSQGSGSESGGGGSGSGSDGGGSQGSGSGSGSGGSQGSGSGSGGGGSGSGSDGGGSQGSGSGSGSGGSEGGGSEGSGNGAGNGSNANSVEVNIFIYIVNISITYFWRKINK